jgi:hypothetical protein
MSVTYNHLRSTAASSSSRWATEAARLEEQTVEFLDDDKLNNVDEIYRKYSSCDTTPKDIYVRLHTGFLCFLLLHLEGNVPTILVSLKVDYDMNVSACIRGVPLCKKLLKPYLTEGRITHLSQLLNLLSFLKTCETKSIPSRWMWIDLAVNCLRQHCMQYDGTGDPFLKSITFIIEQLNLLKCSQYNRKYSSFLLTFAYIIYAASASCYSTLRDQNILCLPHKRTLNRISQKLDTSNENKNRTYLKMRISKLSSFATNVIMLIDEVYVSGGLEYSGGSITGQGEDGKAKTVLCFMISSVCGSYRDTVRLVPTHRLTADTLHSHFMEVLRFVEAVGFFVVAISVDNHPVNRSFYTNKLCGGKLKLSIPHPLRPDSPLFPLFDMTHNIKNVFNNLQNRRLFHLPPLPQNLSSAIDLPSNNAFTVAPIKVNFQHIHDVFDLEEQKPVKAAYKLKKTCFNPSSIEKTSVKFSAAVFHESTHSALTYYSSTTPDRLSWAETAVFLKLIAAVWKIVNVKTPMKGKHKRDDSQSPIASSTDWKLTFLEQFSNYLQVWQQSQMPGLSRETFLALGHTVAALVPLARYLLHERSFHYVLLGFLQSDKLESRLATSPNQCPHYTSATPAPTF